MSVRPVSLGIPIVLVACAGPRAAAPSPQQPGGEAASPQAAGSAAVPSPAPAGSGIRFNVDPPDALVQLNGRDIGTVAALGPNGAVRLAPGIYRVTLRRDGFEPWRAEVAVRGGYERLQVSLVRRSP
jgi:hypothetical protein